MVKCAEIDLLANVLFNDHMFACTYLDCDITRQRSLDQNKVCGCKQYD